MTVVALSDRAATVQHSLCRNVSSLSLFGGLECAKVNLGVVVRYACSKSRAIFENAKSACRFVAYLCFLLVLNVLRLCDVAQVYKTIVRSVAVFMVNLTNWPQAGHVQPSKSMTFMQLVVNGSDHVSFIRKTAGCFSLAYARLFKSAREHPRFWVVVKHFFESCLCKHLRTLTHFERA